MGNEHLRYACNCCGFHTLADPSTGSYEICPVCFWENDPIQSEDPEYTGGANTVCLIDARENYFRVGASEPGSLAHVRSVGIDDVPSVPLLNELDGALRTEATKSTHRLLAGVMRAVQAGKIGILDGCCAIAGLGFYLREPQIREILLTFEIISGECDEFPTGETRELWSSEALRARDAEAADYERRVRDRVLRACVALQERLSRLP